MVNTFGKITHSLLIAATVFLSVMAIGCGQQDNEANKSKPVPGQVSIVSEGMNFKMADTIYSGWNTFTYHNESPDVHLFMIEKYPGDRGVDSFLQEIVPVFQEGMDKIIEGKMDSAMAAFGAFPPWFQEVVYMGGSGLTGPGKTSEITVPVEPGTHVVECYVKMPDGKFHAMMGMATEFYASNDSSGKAAPEANVHISLSSEKGMELQEQPVAGKQVFAVHFTDQKVYENFLGHDVNLVRLDENASLDTLQHWINWMEPKGLVSPAPAGFEFLGGIQDMPAGSTSYFTADLGPGRYALISEIPEASKKNMLVTFTIP